jgi:hypothetical protein
MYLLELITLCAGARCAEVGHTLITGFLLALILLLLNLPRVSVWAVDSWNQRRRGHGGP